MGVLRLLGIGTTAVVAAGALAVLTTPAAQVHGAVRILGRASTEPAAPVDGAGEAPHTTAGSSGPIGDFARNPWVRTGACAAGPPGRRALVLGDSVVLRARQQLLREFGRAGYATCIAARNGQPTGAALDAYAATGLPGYVDVLVVATGANDIFEPEAARESAARVTALAAGRRVVWVTTFVSRTNTDPALAGNDLRNAATVNDAWRYEARRHAGQQVAEWDTVVHGRSAELLVDGVHPNLAGQQAWAECVAAALTLLT